MRYWIEKQSLKNPGIHILVNAGVEPLKTGAYFLKVRMYLAMA